jgi:hypothetical protein
MLALVPLRLLLANVVLKLLVLDLQLPDLLAKRSCLLVQQLDGVLRHLFLAFKLRLKTLDHLLVFVQPLPGEDVLRPLVRPKHLDVNLLLLKVPCLKCQLLLLPLNLRKPNSEVANLLQLLHTVRPNADNLIVLQLDDLLVDKDSIGVVCNHRVLWDLDHRLFHQEDEFDVVLRLVDLLFEEGLVFAEVVELVLLVRPHLPQMFDMRLDLPDVVLDLLDLLLGLQLLLPLADHLLPVDLSDPRRAVGVDVELLLYNNRGVVVQ